MKKVILVGIICLINFTGCSKTVKPDTITKSIMDKYHIQYLNEDKKAKEWLTDDVLENFFIHMEIDKNEDYEQIKEAILHAYDKQNRQELKKYFIKRGKSYEELLKKEKSVSNIKIKKTKQVKTLNSKNIFYSVIHFSATMQYVKYYKKFGTADYNGFGTLTYKYGFIEPKDSNKAYFYTNHGLDSKGNAISRKDKSYISSMDDVRIYGLLFDKKDEYDSVFIKKMLTLLKSKQVPYKYISNEYKLVKGRAGYKEVSLDE